MNSRSFLLTCMRRGIQRRKQFSITNYGQCDATLETMEGRFLLASISGISYVDLNGDGVRESSEQPLAGATIYLDANHNLRLDADEATVTTDTNGAYLFTNLATGNYLVEEIAPPSWKITSPTAATPAATPPGNSKPSSLSSSQNPPALHRLVARSIPDDPLFAEQWHLLNTGQTGGLAGADANVTSVWDQYQGDGVTIGVVDDGMATTHLDLADNYDASDSYDFDDNDSDPSPDFFDDHGTAVAGVAAARGNNGIGVTGAAPHAKIAALRLIAAPTDDQMEADALSYHDKNIDIYNNSWGPTDDGETLEGPGPLARAAIVDGITQGRNGKGDIYVWAAGNGLFDDDNTNYDGYANNRYVIAVSAIDHNGVQAEYSEPGAPILIAGYSSNADEDPGIVTTDREGDDGYAVGDYTDLTGDGSFGGTSSAAPLVSGVVALMLQANPNLTWRDVQAILANSARKNDPEDIGWSQNGAKHWINSKYGFGAIDAAAAVVLAKTWSNLPAETSISSGKINVNQVIPDNNVTGRISNFTTNRLLKVEKVEVVFDATHPFRGDLRVVLTSPDGTQSILADGHADPNEDYSNWTFSTVRDWDEIAQGTWTLRVTDTARGDVGKWNSWQINLYGTALGPGAAYLHLTSAQSNLTAPDFGNLPPGAFHVTSADFPSEVAANRLVFGFDGDVGSVISSADIQIQNQTTGFVVPSDAVHVDFNSTTREATFTVTGLNHSSLPDGNYVARLLASDFSESGLSLDGNNDGIAGDDFVFSFFQLKGDINRDRKVDNADLAVLLSHLGAPSVASSQGDLTYDGKVDFSDFQAMELAFGDSLSAPVAAAPALAPSHFVKAAKASKLAKTIKPAQILPLPVVRPLFSTKQVRRNMDLLDSPPRRA